MSRSESTVNASGDQLTATELDNRSVVWNHELGEEVASVGTYREALKRMRELAREGTPDN